jgi:starch phosphorylase
MLGIGGWRLLERLGIDVEVCHLNEGHAAFVVLDRARSFMDAHRCSFHEALAVTRAGNVFTTHTPVAVGFDRFEPALIKRYLGWVAESVLHIDLEDLLALGRADPADGSEPFSMAHLAMRGSAAVNGVSRLHGEVSRRIFQPLFPRWPQAEVPVSHVTNGVHVPSWDSKEADELWTRLCGADRWRGTMEDVTRDFRAASDVELLQMRAAGRLTLVHYARERLAKQLAAEGASVAEIAQAQRALDPNALTIGFARRFATYKRPNLLLHDPDRLARILTDPRQPVQLIIAGKAHPRDEAGQAMVKAWVEFIRDRAQVRAHAVFLSDHDMLLSECLVQGVDLWINTPRRPWEASGTSGMKVLVNGGLNLSELDGWWAEAYSPDVGWALGDGREHGDDPAWDAEEARALYSLLEQEVIPAFYTRDAQGVPAAWVARMRESMARLTPQFSSNRSVREYTESYYIPSAGRYRRRAAQGAHSGQALVQWQRELARHWHNLHFGNLDVQTTEDHHRFSVQVYLDELDPQMLQVELYADPRADAPLVRQPMTCEVPLPGTVNGYIYSARVPATRPAEEFVPRIVPHHPEAIVPLEAAWILWRT